MQMRKIILTAVLAMGASSVPAVAHSGGTDAYGCHTNHTTGVYHCHNRGEPVQKVTTPKVVKKAPVKPVKVAVR